MRNAAEPGQAGNSTAAGHHWRLLSTLTRHFVRRFTSLDAVAPGTEVKQALIPILCMLALPGYVLSYAAFVGAAQMNSDPLRLYAARWLMLIWSFVVVGLLATVQWEAFFIDWRDRLNLGPLPVPQATVFLAKLASLLIAVLLFHLGVNLFSGLIFPLAFPLFLYTATVHQGVLLLQSLCVALGIASLEGTVALLLPARLARRASHAMQSLLLVVLASILMMQAELGRWVRETRSMEHALNVLFPPAWFMALYDRLLGAGTAAGTLPTRLALFGTLAAGIMAFGLCLYSMRAAGTAQPEVSSAPSRWRRVESLLERPLEWLLLRSPRERAVYQFAHLALTRGRRSRLILGAWVAVGIALSLAALVPWLTLPGGARKMPAPALLAPAHILSLFGLLGLRLSAAFPVELEANWVFRLTEWPSSPEYVRGIRATALRAIVAPLFLLLAPSYVALAGSSWALPHLAFSLLVALLTGELLFLRFSKIPFTCSYVPGRARLRVRWPLYLAVGLFYCGVLPEVECGLLRHPGGFTGLLLVLLATAYALGRWRDRAAERNARLVFDEIPPPFITRLHLST